MGFYSDYLDNPALHNDISVLTAERKKQLNRISNLRGNRDVLVFATDIGKAALGNLGGLLMISYPDILPSCLLPAYNSWPSANPPGVSRIRSRCLPFRCAPSS